MYNPKTSKDTHNVIFSPESAAGAERLNLQGGRKTLKYGQDHPHAKTHRVSPQSTANNPELMEQEQAWRWFGWSLLSKKNLVLLFLKTFPDLKKTPVRSSIAWDRLDLLFPEKNERLSVLVRLISAGACSPLPSVMARDGRNVGRIDHPRRFSGRGQPLPETFGEKICPALAQWMMGFPEEWLKYAPSEMQSSRK